jgi:hypothetical protein
MKGKVLERSMDTRDEFLARILGAASHTKEREVQLRRTICDLRKRVAKITEVAGGIFEYLLQTLKNFSYGGGERCAQGFGGEA